MTWHRPRPPKRGPLPAGVGYFRLRVQPHEPPEGARPYPELRPIIERKLKQLAAASHASAGAAATYQTQKSILLRALADLPDHPVPADVQAWRDGLVARWGCSVRTANKFRDSISAAYEFDRGRGGEVNNPCLDVRRLRTNDPIKPALAAPKAGLSAKEVFRRAFAAMPDERRRMALAYCYVLGLRRSEMCGLEAHHFDLRDPDNASVRLTQQRKPVARDSEPQPLKGEKRRILPIPRWMAEATLILTRAPVWLPPSRRGANQFDPPVRSRFLFPFNTGDLTDIHERIRAAVPEALPEGRGLHELRHAFAEVCLEHYHGNLTEAAKRLGHSSEAVTAQYARGRYGHFEVKRDEGLFSDLTGADFSTRENLSSPAVGGGVQADSRREKRVDSGTQKVGPDSGRSPKLIAPNARNARGRKGKKKR